MNESWSVEEPAWGRPVPPPARRTREWVIAGLLLIATVASTWLVQGPAFSFWLLTILFCHEMGHFLTARRYGVSTSLPLFIPLPISPFGTMGAIIRLRERIRSRRVLFDVGIGGPLAGIPPSLAACLWGLSQSKVVDKQALDGPHLKLGGSLLFTALERFYFGSMGPGQDLLLHPIAFAGWAGLFVTSMNLLPIGQLDGGHVLYGLVGRHARWASLFFALTLLVAGYWFPGWWVLLIFLAVATRFRSAQTYDEQTPLSRGRLALGIFVLLFFVLTFIPRPVTIE